MDVKRRPGTGRTECEGATVNNSVNSTILGIPLNRIVAFLGPYVAVVSGAVAAWLLTHLHVLSMFHLSDSQVATAISQLTVFGITAGLTWLGHQKWLTGHQIELAAAVKAAAAVAPADQPPDGTASERV
jgi:hypothetical protein